MTRYVVIRRDRGWVVWDRVGQSDVIKASYRDCLAYAQKANRQLDLIPLST